MTDLFDGDPFIDIGADGAEMIFIGGQPVMDQGFDNHVNFSLLTEKGWWGNDAEPVAERKLGSLFLDASKKPITRQSLINTDKAAQADLSGEEFGTVISETINNESNNLLTEILFTPPTRELQKLVLNRAGQNWINLTQKETYQRLKPSGKVTEVELKALQTVSGDNITTQSGDQILVKVTKV